MKGVRSLLLPTGAFPRSTSPCPTIACPTARNRCCRCSGNSPPSLFPSHAPACACPPCDIPSGCSFCSGPTGRNRDRPVVPVLQTPPPRPPNPHTRSKGPLPRGLQRSAGPSMPHVAARRGTAVTVCTPPPTAPPLRFARTAPCQKRSRWRCCTFWSPHVGYTQGPTYANAETTPAPRALATAAIVTQRPDTYKCISDTYTRINV